MPAASFDLTAPAERQRLRELTEHVARIGGEIASSRYGHVRDVRFKNDRSEVSDADEAAQAAMIAFLTENRPDDAIIAEEGSSGSDVPPSSERLTWVLDPIDGTRSYLRQTGSWCTSVGVMHAGFPISGAIFVPQDDKLYAAVKGDRLVVNGNDCERFAPQYPRPGKMVVGIPSTATGVTYDLAHQWLDQHVVRNLGSTALHLVYVATGQFEAALSANSKLWDIAGGACLVEAAGARLTSPRGEDIFPIDVAAYDKDEIATLAAQSRSHGDFIHAR